MRCAALLATALLFAGCYDLDGFLRLDGGADGELEVGLDLGPDSDVGADADGADADVGMDGDMGADAMQDEGPPDMARPPPLDERFVLDYAPVGEKTEWLDAKGAVRLGNMFVVVGRDENNPSGLGRQAIVTGFVPDANESRAVHLGVNSNQQLLAVTADATSAHAVGITRDLLGGTTTDGIYYLEIRDDAGEEGRLRIVRQLAFDSTASNEQAADLIVLDEPGGVKTLALAGVTNFMPGRDEPMIGVTNLAAPDGEGVMSTYRFRFDDAEPTERFLGVWANDEYIVAVGGLNEVNVDRPIIAVFGRDSLVAWSGRLPNDGRLLDVTLYEGRLIAVGENGSDGIRYTLDLPVDDTAELRLSHERLPNFALRQVEVVDGVEYYAGIFNGGGATGRRVDDDVIVDATGLRIPPLEGDVFQLGPNGFVAASANNELIVAPTNAEGRVCGSSETTRFIAAGEEDTLRSCECGTADCPCRAVQSLSRRGVGYARNDITHDLFDQPCR